MGYRQQDQREATQAEQRLRNAELRRLKATLMDQMRGHMTLVHVNDPDLPTDLEWWPTWRRP